VEHDLAEVEQTRMGIKDRQAELMTANRAVEMVMSALVSEKRGMDHSRKVSQLSLVILGSRDILFPLLTLLLYMILLTLLILLGSRKGSTEG
jgi:hypothetical protein